MSSNTSAKLSELSALVKRVAFLGRGEAYDAVRKSLAAEAMTQVSLGFRLTRDPYGAAWAPLKRKRRRGSVVLTDTGRLRRSYSTTITPSGFAMHSNVKYAVYHQGGTRGRKSASSRFQPVDAGGRFVSRKSRGKRPTAGLTGGRVDVRHLSFKAGTGGLPSRKMLPEKTLGPIWRKAFTKTANAAFKRFLRKR